MQIYVCIKNVPDTAANIKVTGPAEFNESIKFVVNPYDKYGVKEAVQIAEQTGGEVVIVTVGKETAVTAIRSALAMGAARGILVRTDEQFRDSAITSQALKRSIEADGSPDLIFTGKQSVDSEGMQTQYRLARAFNMPVVTEVVSLEIANSKAIVDREVGGGMPHS
jgi:electron transfer flavoprotein beta subunit